TAKPRLPRRLGTRPVSRVLTCRSTSFRIQTSSAGSACLVARHCPRRETMTMTAPKDWTPEQRQNAMTYGLCRVCREPREARVTETTQDGKTVVTRALVCPNGHAQ